MSPKSIFIITIHPQIIETYRNFGVLKAAESKGLAKIHVINLRDYAVDAHGSIDARPYGGGDGMVMRPEPLAEAVKAIPDRYVILSSPRGQRWDQKAVLNLREQKKNLVFICGRFGGVDERFVEKYVDAEYSLGDFILSGGELAALCFADSILRVLPGVLGHEDSSEKDSFSGDLENLLEHPLYTKPPIFEEAEVPPVLLSGHHQKIQQWQHEQSLALTKKLRPDLFKKA